MQTLRRIGDGLGIRWNTAQLNGLLVAFAFRLDGVPDVLQFAGQVAINEDFGPTKMSDVVLSINYANELISFSLTETTPSRDSLPPQSRSSAARERFFPVHKYSRNYNLFSVKYIIMRDLCNIRFVHALVFKHTKDT